MALRRLTAVIALLFMLAMSAGANTYYTATTGSDTNPGTLSLPFRTITYGAQRLAPGDTLYVRGGDYAESFIGNIPSGTSWSAPVTLSAYPGEQVTIKPAAAPESVFMFVGPQHYIAISGFVIDGTNIQYDCVKVTVSSSTGVADHIRIQNCEILNAPNQGILVTDGANYNEFLNSNIHDCGFITTLHTLPPDHYHGIYIATDHNLVQGCVVHHNAGYGIHCYDDSGTTVNYNTVCGNMSFDNGVAGLSGAGIILSSGTGNVAYNNVIYSDKYGISVDYSAINTHVYNNTVYGNRAYGIYIGAGSTNATIENNISYNNAWAPDIINDGGSGTVFITNLAGVDPLFLNAAAYDFHLTSGSPAIDTATTIAGLVTDFDGIPRPQGPAPDIGAYEFSSSTAITPSTYSISGAVTSGGTGLAGATVSAGGVSAVTASDGSYTLTGLAAGTDTVSATMTGYDFSAAQTVTLGPNATGINFTASAVSLATLAINPSTVPGGTTTTGSVTLSMPAPTGGCTVTLTSNSTKATVPTSVTVPAGQTSATFSVQTSRVKSTKSVSITGKCAAQISASLTITVR